MPRTSAKPKTRSRKVNRASAAPTAKKKPIEQYDHKGKQRVNNPPVGLVTPDTDHETAKRTYAYDPHLDPQLVWAGKAEHTSFEVPTVSLHVHERIDPRTIIEAVRKHDEAGPSANLDEWIKAVNQHGGFGKWKYAVSLHPADVKDNVQRAIAT